MYFLGRPDSRLTFHPFHKVHRVNSRLYEAPLCDGAIATPHMHMATRPMNQQYGFPHQKEPQDLDFTPVVQLKIWAVNCSST